MSIYNLNTLALLKWMYENALRLQESAPLKSGPITSEWVERQIALPTGIWDLGRMLHPYTLDVLAHPDRPHTDEKFETDPYRAPLGAEGEDGHLPMGVVNVNWAEAAVLDGLAEYVVTFDQGIYTVIEQQDGKLRKTSYEKLPAKYVEGAKNRLWMTVDLDFFHLANKDTPDVPLKDLSFPVAQHLIRKLVKYLIHLGLHPLGLTIAVSPDYLSPTARNDPLYVQALQLMIQTEFEAAFAAGRQAPAARQEREDA